MRQEEEHKKAEEERALAWDAREKKRLEEEEEQRLRQLEEEQAHAIARDQARKLALVRESQMVCVCVNRMSAHVFFSHTHARISFLSVCSFRFV